MLVRQKKEDLSMYVNELVPLYLILWNFVINKVATIGRKIIL